MAVLEITNPTIYLNGNLWATAPNSMKITMGFGEQDVKARSIGNGDVDTVFCNNVEEKVGKMSWENFATDDTLGFLNELKFLGNLNSIRIDTNTGHSYVLQNAAFVNDPEIAFAANEKYAIEWKGDPVVQSY